MLSRNILLYKTMVARVVHSCPVDDKVTSQKKHELTASSMIKKFTFFLTLLTRGHRPKYFPKVCIAKHSHNQFYKNAF